MEEGRKPIVSMLTLGCKVNQYETQRIKEQFKEAGYELAEPEAFADVYVINTCTVTGLSDRKSRQYIRKAKRINPDSITAVIGCYAQVSTEEACSIEGVNIVAGTNEKNHLVEYIEQYRSGFHGGDSEKESVSCHVKSLGELIEYEECGSITAMDSRTRAFIKIQEGCNRFCSYCIIPYARGAVRSRRIGDILNEAKLLIGKGFKELVLTGINTALYGTEEDFWSNNESSIESVQREVYGIEIMVSELNAMPGEFRIRLSSLEPTVVDAEYAARLLRYEKLCPHLHLSLQSGSDRILRRMNRNYTKDDYLKIVERLKSFDEGYAITTDIIVGFPGETEEDFQNSIDMVERVGFCKVHGFSYSKRKGTEAAQMEEQIPSKIKSLRNTALLQVANRISEEFFQRNLGSIRTVLTERYDEETGLLSGFSENYIKVYFEGTEGLLNSFVKVMLKECYKDGVKGLILF